MPLRVLLALAAVALVATETPAAADRRPTLRAAFERMPGSVGESSVTALDDNTDAWAARWQAMANAKRSLDANYFIVENDVFGVAFLAHLYMRARDGVKVSLLIDGRGSAPLALPFLGLDELQELVATGNADVRVFNPPLWKIAETVIERSAVPISAGAHGKILVFDNRAAITGGRNIGGVYFAQEGEWPGAVVDSDIYVHGGAPVAGLAAVARHEFSQWKQERVRRDVVNFDDRSDALRIVYFAMDAYLRGRIPAAPAAETALLLEGAAIEKLAALPTQETRASVRPYLQQLARVPSLRGSLFGWPSAPRPPSAHLLEARVVASQSRVAGWDDTANDSLMQAMTHARHRIWIQSPYFMLTPRVLGVLERASARGVDIRVLTNGPTSSDNAASQALFIDTWPELQARMPTLRVFVATHQMRHTKRVVVDDTLTLVGSHNLDPLSSHLNSEIVIALWSRAMNEDAAALFEASCARDDAVEYRIHRLPAGRPLRDRGGRIVTEFGPEDHVDDRRLAELRGLKEFLFSIRRIWDFDFVVW